MTVKITDRWFQKRLQMEAKRYGIVSKQQKKDFEKLLEEIPTDVMFEVMHEEAERLSRMVVEEINSQPFWWPPLSEDYRKRKERDPDLSDEMLKDPAGRARQEVFQDPGRGAEQRALDGQDELQQVGPDPRVRHRHGQGFDPCPAPLGTRDQAVEEVHPRHLQPHLWEDLPPSSGQAAEGSHTRKPSQKDQAIVRSIAVHLQSAIPGGSK